jgi:hypothetical protein
MGYCTLAELKSALHIIDTIDDTMLGAAINSASDFINAYTNRDFTSAGTATRYFAADDNYNVVIDDLQSINELATSTKADMNFDVTWSASDYQLTPVNGRVNGLASPYTGIRAVNRIYFPYWNDMTLVRVTGVWGWASVPNNVKQACIMQASRIFKRLDSPLGVAGFGDMGVMRVSNRIDPDVAQLLDPYRDMRNLA